VNVRAEQIWSARGVRRAWISRIADGEHMREVLTECRGPQDRPALTRAARAGRPCPARLTSARD
jgi:hypothetical protein